MSRRLALCPLCARFVEERDEAAHWGGAECRLAGRRRHSAAEGGQDAEAQAKRRRLSLSRPSATQVLGSEPVARRVFAALIPRQNAADRRHGRRELTYRLASLREALGDAYGLARRLRGARFHLYSGNWSSCKPILPLLRLSRLRIAGAIGRRDVLERVSRSPSLRLSLRSLSICLDDAEARLRGRLRLLPNLLRLSVCCFRDKHRLVTQVFQQLVPTGLRHLRLRGSAMGASIEFDFCQRFGLLALLSRLGQLRLLGVPCDPSKLWATFSADLKAQLVAQLTWPFFGSVNHHLRRRFPRVCAPADIQPSLTKAWLGSPEFCPLRPTYYQRLTMLRIEVPDSDANKRLRPLKTLPSLLELQLDLAEFDAIESWTELARTRVERLRLWIHHPFWRELPTLWAPDCLRSLHLSQWYYQDGSLDEPAPGGRLLPPGRVLPLLRTLQVPLPPTSPVPASQRLPLGVEVEGPASLVDGAVGEVGTLPALAFLRWQAVRRVDRHHAEDLEFCLTASELAGLGGGVGLGAALLGRLAAWERAVEELQRDGLSAALRLL